MDEDTFWLLIVAAVGGPAVLGWAVGQVGSTVGWLVDHGVLVTDPLLRLPGSTAGLDLGRTLLVVAAISALIAAAVGGRKAARRRALRNSGR